MIILGTIVYYSYSIGKPNLQKSSMDIKHAKLAFVALSLSIQALNAQIGKLRLADILLMLESPKSWGGVLDSPESLQGGLDSPESLQGGLDSPESPQGGLGRFGLSRDGTGRSREFQILMGACQISQSPPQALWTPRSFG